MKHLGTMCVVLLLCLGCGGPQEPAHGDLSTAAHYKEARRHERVADGHDEAVKRNRERVGTRRVECINRPLAGTPTSGTENLQVMKPCWTSEEDPASVAHRRSARNQRLLAAEHRAKARALLLAEQKACRGLAETDISRSPFWHRDDISSVTPLKKRGAVTGVTVVFKKVRGLSVEWMTRSVACHRARAAALGFRTDFMVYCPLMLASIEAEVTESKAGIVVTITSKRSEMAAAALGRVRDGERLIKRSRSR